MTDTIDYNHLMHTAMRGLMSELLGNVGKTGLPGDHHFFITFETQAEGVELSDWLREKYADEMTIVIQNWFEDLTVSDTGFSITLNFGDAPERMTIPFDAVQTFVDPSVEFGLRFEVADVEPIIDPDDESPMIDIEDVPEEKSKPKEADVVSLDQFRK